MPSYSQYDDSLNPQIDNEFAAAAFRYGHALVPSSLEIINRRGQVEDELELKDLFANPEYVTA